ncbi:MAG: helix-turn-helix domain-containing protein [Kiritimatiellia bacterium]|jgi:hypothetical protein
MTAKERRRKLNEVGRALEGGSSMQFACAEAGVSVAWYKRWRARLEEAGLEGLADLPRSGRPPAVEVSEEDAAKLRSAYLRSNRGRNAGSMTMAARSLAKRGALAPELCAEILRERASKHQLPTGVARAMRAAPAEVARYRDPDSGRNDGIFTPGWLRMAEDGSRRLLPGEKHVWDDGSVNVGVLVPWTRGGDACSRRYGVRLGRYQLLACVDCATDFVVGYSYVARGNDAYSAGDAVRAMHGVWQGAGYAPREVVLEGGPWQGGRVLDFLEAAGVRMVSAKSKPNQKLVEGYFDRLWTALSVKLEGKGQLGRQRGEMAEETKDWIACREGRRDPRGLFPMLDEFLAALDRAIEFVNGEPVESRTYGEKWIPAEEYAGARANGRPLVGGLWRLALPVVEERTMRRQGMVRVQTMSPFGFPHVYVFACEEGWRYDGARVRVAFDPYAIRSGAALTLARPWRGLPAGTVIADAAPCISPAPDVMALGGALDPREDAARIKKASRALVAESVAAFDERSGKARRRTLARGTSPTLAALDYLHGRAARVEEDEDALEALRRSRQTAALATDWAAEERAAGILV